MRESKIGKRKKAIVPHEPPVRYGRPPRYDRSVQLILDSPLQIRSRPGRRLGRPPCLIGHHLIDGLAFFSFNHCRLGADKQFSVSEIQVKAVISLLIVAALSGCAQLQAMRSDGTPTASAISHPSIKIVDFTIPPDALGAHDPHLAAVLAKAGALASKQTQPTTIVIAALAQDFPYLNQAVKRGIAPARAAQVRLDDVTVGSCQPYSVQIKPTE